MLFAIRGMASLAQNSAALGACLSSNKNFNAQLLYKKTHFSNLVANFQVSKPTFCPLVIEGQKKQGKAWCSHDGIVPDHEYLPPPSAVDVVQRFYDAFDAKDTQKLEQLLVDQCVYQDLVFYGPFEGKESVIHFLRSAMEAMGPNIHIFIEEVKEVGHLTVAAFWHLEWKNKKIPYGGGCRFFAFEEVEGKLYISKITDVEELPVKPGELALKVLKAVGTLFDRYPLAADAILQSYESHEGFDMHIDLFGRK